MRSAYVDHKRVAIKFDGVSRTRQEFKEECDINSIMRRYERTGAITHVNRASPRYLDFSSVPDFHTAMNTVVQAEFAFSQLPATVRKRFGNDPAEFVKFAEDAENIEQVREWGLAPPAVARPEPVEVKVVSPVEPPGEAPKASEKPV